MVYFQWNLYLIYREWQICDKTLHENWFSSKSKIDMKQFEHDMEMCYSLAIRQD